MTSQSEPPTKDVPGCTGTVGPVDTVGAIGTDPRVYLDGHLDVPPARLGTVLAALPVHIALTRDEVGCLSFEVTEAVDVPGRLVVSEVFSDRAAFEHHQRRTRASDWFTVSEGIPRSYTIRGLDPEK